LGQLGLQELSFLGNPACKSDYWKRIITDVPSLNKLDGVNVCHLTEEEEEEDEDPSILLPEGDLRMKELTHSKLPNFNGDDQE